MTFDAYLTDVLSRVHPGGYSARLRSSYKAWLKDFFIELQRYIPQLQQSHIEYIGQDATFFKCGCSAFTAPAGCTVTVRAQGGGAFPTSIIDGNGLTGNGTTGIHSTASRYELMVIIANSSTAGTVHFQFAQNASNGIATTVSKNSVMIVTRSA